MIDVYPAELAHRIAFLEAVESKDDDGLPVYDWSEKYVARAKVVNLVGKEYFDETAPESKTTIKLWIRYNKNVPLSSEKLRFDGRFWNIIYANDVEYKRRWIEVRAELYEQSRN